MNILSNVTEYDLTTHVLLSADFSYNKSLDVVSKELQDQIVVWLNSNLPLSYNIVKDDSNLSKLIRLMLILVRASQTGYIENARFKEYKSMASSVIKKIYNQCEHSLEWRDHISVEEINYLIFNIDVETSRGRVSALKKLKSKPSNVYYDNLITIISELMIFNEFEEYLKSIIVKRKVKTITDEEYVERGEKHICGYCFGAFRKKNFKNATMAYHGFSRVKHWGNTASCNGAYYLPLKESPDATLKLIKDIEYTIENGKDNTDAKIEALYDYLSTAKTMLKKFHPDIEV